MEEVNPVAAPPQIPEIQSSFAICKTPAEKVRKFAILLIDAALSYDSEGNELGYMEEVLTKANSRGWPVFQFEYCGAHTHPSLEKHKTDRWVFTDKPYFSAFKKTKLERQLRKAGITDVIVMGFSQEACVLETTRDAARLGFKVHTSFDVIQGGYDECVMDFYERATKLAPRYSDLPVFATHRAHEKPEYSLMPKPVGFIFGRQSVSAHY